MKLLHLVSGADSGGAKTHVLSLLSELGKTDDVLLVCLGDGALSRGAAAQGLGPVVLRGGFFAQRAELDWLLQTHRPDVLHCHGARANLMGAISRREIVTRLVSTVHSDHTLDYLSRPAAALTIGRLNGWALGRMDALVCVSDAMAALYRRRGFENVFPLYNGLDFSLPLPEQCPRGENLAVGTAARLDPVKDLPTLLRGFALAAEQEPRLRLHIAGTGPEEKRLRALAGTLKIADRVEFCGWVEDVERFYALLDVVALTSLSETFPYALLMAARQGLPVVATDVGGVSALVKDGTSGFLIEPGDARALARALRQLAGDREQRRTMGQNLRALAEKRFTLTGMARTQREIYRQVLDKE